MRYQLGLQILAELTFCNRESLDDTDLLENWPELGYAAVDAFTCGDHVEPSKAVQVLQKGLAAQCITTMEMNRGMHPSIPLLEQADQQANRPQA